MATTTPNYGWDVPTSTDYVKDGAVAIETLGDDIDATLYTLTGGRGVGLQPLVTQSFTGSSALAVNNVFTSTYTNYLIIMDSMTTSASGNDIMFQLTSGGTASSTSYKWTRAYQSYASAAWNTSASTSSGSQPLGWVSSTVGQSKEVMVFRPQVTGFTQIMNNSIAIDGAYLTYGQHEQATAYDGFRLIPEGAYTISGVLRIYGIRNS